MHISKVRLYPEKYPTRDYYPFSMEIFQKTKEIEFLTPVTLFVGENGTGKSTLLKAICKLCDIHIWEGVERERVSHNPFEEKLYTAAKVEWVNSFVPGSFFGSDIFRNFTQLLDEWAAADPGQLNYFGGKSLITQSHGQSLMSYFTSLYKIKGLYFLDEPETALSPRNQIKLLELLNRMGKAGHAQFIVATHSPILLACPDAVIYCFNFAPVKQVGYEETDHYQIYRDFLQGWKQYLDKM